MAPRRLPRKQLKEVQETTGTTPNPEQRKTPTTESVTNPKKQSPIGWNLREPVDKRGLKVRAVRIFHTLNQEE